MARSVQSSAKDEGEVGSLLPPPSPRSEEEEEVEEIFEDLDMELDGPFCPRCGSSLDMELVYKNDREVLFAATCQGPQGHPWNVSIGITAHDFSIFEAIGEVLEKDL